MLQLKLGTKGELVIPKKIRDQLGFSRYKRVLLEIKEEGVLLRAPATDVVKRCRDRAKKIHADVSKWKMGDELYEEVFDVPGL